MDRVSGDTLKTVLRIVRGGNIPPLLELLISTISAPRPDSIPTSSSMLLAQPTMVKSLRLDKAAVRSSEVMAIGSAITMDTSIAGPHVSSNPPIRLPVLDSGLWTTAVRLDSGRLG